MGYRKIYFRIESQYTRSQNWVDDHAKQRFQEELHRLFCRVGWTICPSTFSGVCATAVKGQQDLYLHPASFSGIILEEEIPPLEALFAQAETFRCYHVDRYEEYLDLSDGEYQALLETKRAEITAEILNRCRTKRKNLFVTGPVALDVAKYFAIPRLSDKDKNGSVINQFVSQIVTDLLAEGRLITAKTKYGPGLRTATEKEQQIPVRNEVNGQITM